MAKRVELRAAEREGFSLLAEAAFANPFGVERAAIDLKIAGAAGPVPRDERLRLLLPRVTARIRDLEAQKKADLGAFLGRDREVVETVLLFDAYYHAAASFDDLIQSQLRHGEEPCPVPFATEALSRLRRQGFTPPEALRNFALLYQLRRAYFFIGHDLVGRSPCMRGLRKQLWDAVVTHDIRSYVRCLVDRMEEFSTLILGETGTGKGTAAAAIGRSGFIPFDEKRGRFAESFTRAFVSINLSQFSESLIESELFGHKKGAFTGAINDQDGILSHSSPCGAVLLDEIGEVGAPVQIKLLQVLQERRFSPVGSRRRHAFRGRILAATNRPLGELRAGGRLRDDFFYRLCSSTITVPPLRQRLAEDAEELNDLLAHTLRRLLHADAPDLLQKARSAIEKDLPRDYAWPGNVRELEQCLRCVLLTGRCAVDAREAGASATSRIASQIARGELDARELLASYCSLLHERHRSFNEVARRTGLDRRTVRKYIAEARR